MTVTIPTLIAGCLVRRQIRHAIRSAEVLGATIAWCENWGLLESVFTIRGEGDEQQLKPIIDLIDTRPLKGGS